MELVWFKDSDLRVRDHEPLFQANKTNNKLIHIFTWDCRWDDKTSNDVSNMSKINIIPKPKSVKLNTHSIDLGLINKIATATNSDSEIKIAKMVQELVSPIKKLPVETSSEKTPGSIFIMINNDKNFPKGGCIIA